VTDITATVCSDIKVTSLLQKGFIAILDMVQKYTNPNKLSIVQVIFLRLSVSILVEEIKYLRVNN
jgi:hypothetical protein